jgi:hypothetical protein
MNRRLHLIVLKTNLLQSHIMDVCLDADVLQGCANNIGDPTLNPHPKL